MDGVRDGLEGEDGVDAVLPPHLRRPVRRARQEDVGAEGGPAAAVHGPCAGAADPNGLWEGGGRPRPAPPPAHRPTPAARHRATPRQKECGGQ